MPDVAHLLKPKESTPIVSGQTNSGANAMIANRRPGISPQTTAIDTRGLLLRARRPTQYKLEPEDY